MKRAAPRAGSRRRARRRASRRPRHPRSSPSISPRITSRPSRLARGRAATAGPLPIRRTRRAACDSCRTARARTRAPRCVASVGAHVARAARARPGRRGDRSRHSIASAPCPGAGRLSSGSIRPRMRSPKPEPLQAGRGEDDRVVSAFVELAQARVHVAAQRLDDELRKALAQLRLAPQARSADDRAVGQRVERVVAIGNERVARVLARHDRGEREAVGRCPSARLSANARRGRRGLRPSRPRAP